MQTCETVEIQTVAIARPEKTQKTYVSDRMLGPQTSPCQTRFFSFFFRFFFSVFFCFLVVFSLFRFFLRAFWWIADTSQDLVLEVIPFDEEFVEQFGSWNL